MLDFLGMGGWLIPAGILLFGSVTLVYRQRGRIREIIENRRIKNEMEHSDPLTQQVFIPNESGSLPQNSISPEPGEPVKAIAKEFARLTWAGKKPAPPSLEVILLDKPEMLVGRNKKQCQIVLKIPSVENIHALITTSTEGQVKIANRSAKNGTWVNYAPVSSQGANLQPGDLVHFGKAEFRFEIS